MAIWTTLASGVSSALAWIEKHPGLAAYLQALGSLIAIAVAFLSPRIAAQYARREQQAETKKNNHDLAEYLRGLMPRVKVRCSAIKLQIDGQELPPEDMLTWSDWFQSIGYVMEHGLANLIPYVDLTEPGPLAPFVKVTRHLLTFNNKRSTYEFGGLITDLGQWKVLRSTLSNDIKAAESAAAGIMASRKK